MKSKFKTAFLLLGIYISFISVLFYFYHETELQFYPSDEKLKIDFYTDKADNGNSEIIHAINTTTALGINYELKSNFISPYCGVKIHCPNTLNLSGFDKIRLELEGTPETFVRLYILSEDKNVKDKNHYLALRHSQIDYKLIKNNAKFTLDLKEFETPFWWFESIKQTKQDFDKPNFDVVHSFAFSSGSQNPKNEKLYFKIKQISFLKDWNFLFYGFYLFGCLVFVASIFKSKDKKRKVIEIKYQPTKDDTISSGDFMAFIHQNYTDSNLSLEKIAFETSVNYRIISESISATYDCNFKTYINQIRITEAKRLMLETKMSLSEIAYQTGFNSPANFTRVFKHLTSESPTDFLQKAKK